MKCLFWLFFATLALSASPLTDTNFISQVYLDLLHRPADPLAVSTGLTFLAGNSRQSYALTILDSREYRADLVSDYFQSYLGRAPGPTEANGLIMVLDGGGTDQQVQATVLGTSEYFAAQGSNNASFVLSLYSKLLNRPASSGEINPFVTLLNTSAATRSDVALDLLFSSEYEQDLLNSFFQQYLHRSFTSATDNVLLGQLEAQVRNEVVQSEILGSAEYYTLAQQEQTPEPATWAISGAGLVLLTFLRKKRKPAANS